MSRDKPSDFIEHPWGSVLQNCESETVAANVMRILKRTGDTFRPLSEDEYVREREKDGHFTRAELGLLGKVADYCKSPDTAKLFSPAWRG